MIGFIIWSICTLVFVIIGISTWKSAEPAGFFTGVKPPKIPEQNVKKYNHSVAIIWFVFSVIFEMLGLPVLLCEQNSPYLIFTMLGSIFSIIGIIVAYLKVENYYMKINY